MQLYDSIIHDTQGILECANALSLPPANGRIWKDTGESQLIMLRDTAFELGGSGNESVNFTCVTTSGIVGRDEILLCGPDLPQIRKDVPFARIAILEVEDLKETEDTEKAYDTIRSIEYVRYHVFPAGYMVRVSSSTNEEQVRVSRSAMRAGISFRYIGETYIRRYRKLPAVRHVRMAFVTDGRVVEQLKPLAGKVDDITKTLTHILDGLPTDCGHCSMKSVCDEVDGMREMHLGRSSRSADASDH